MGRSGVFSVLTRVWAEIDRTSNHDSAKDDRTDQEISQDPVVLANQLISLLNWLEDPAKCCYMCF